MSATFLIILLTVCALGLFVLGLSLTQIFKGHNIRSEIGENESMKKLGIKCAAQQLREEERAFMGDSGCLPESDCSSGCSSCTPETGKK